eukprot:SAG31_NODE_1002_length_10448_cov_27.630399_11_plen_79_part_00
MAVGHGVLLTSSRPHLAIDTHSMRGSGRIKFSTLNLATATKRFKFSIRTGIRRRRDAVLACIRIHCHAACRTGAPCVK